VPVLALGTGRTKTARLWTYVRDDRAAADDAPPAVWFAYSEDRKGEHPKQHLSRFFGILQAVAGKAVQRIGDLYDIEREVRGKPANVRTEIRQARARPLLDELHRWLNKTLAGLSRKSDTAPLRAKTWTSPSL
jgi:transposase